MRPAFLILLLSLVSCNPSVSEDEIAIRAVRDKSNKALAAHDTTVLAQTITADYNVVTSRNVVSSDRKFMLSRLAADWSSKPDLVYSRSPVNIDVFDDWHMASETGSWVGTWTESNGDKIKLSGSYYAKWHQEGAQWRIRAEIFTPLQCDGGAYCEQGPLSSR